MTKVNLPLRPYLFAAGLICIFVGMLAFIPDHTGVVASTSDETIIRCDPETVVAEIGEPLSFTVFIENVTDLYGADVKMSFDPTKAAVVDADAAKGGTQIEILDDLLQPDFVLRDRADNVAGTIWYAVSHVNPREAVSGSGALFRVTMESLQPGSVEAIITSRELAMRNGVEIPTTIGNCLVTFFDPNAISQTFLPIGIAP